ncbi:unnamed protein product [Toxocara canis]|uniref:Uncharacterized protein n=1 Tax=Toxocara canis TaxID=6265 RepID=A0A183U9U3_TOXCA|nr:unnamed protein product [Toxocara canis]
MEESAFERCSMLKALDVRDLRKLRWSWWTALGNGVFCSLRPEYVLLGHIYLSTIEYN